MPSFPLYLFIKLPSITYSGFLTFPLPPPPPHPAFVMGTPPTPAPMFLLLKWPVHTGIGTTHWMRMDMKGLGVGLKQEKYYENFLGVC